MHYNIKIDEFEGPLDLLLHLINNSNIDIYDISIDEVTKQYLDYINAMEKLDIEIASEYLVMASELMLIKSKSLLPSNKEKEELLEEDEEITRENLINRLVEYQKYKELTKNLKVLELERKKIYIKAPSKLDKITDSKIVNDTDIGVDDLVGAFYNFLERIDKEKPINTKITNKEYSVKKRKNDIKKYLLNKIDGKACLDELFDIYSKSYIVVTFMSILELAKEEEINIEQKENFANIYIELKNN
jgi:segregation and condensation protein A